MRYGNKTIVEVWFGLPKNDDDKHTKNAKKSTNEGEEKNRKQ